MFSRKVRKTGNSLSVTLPPSAISHMNIGADDFVYITHAPGGSVRVTPYDSEFEGQMRIAESLMRRYRNTLRKLSD